MCVCVYKYVKIIIMNVCVHKYVKLIIMNVCVYKYVKIIIMNVCVYKYVKIIIMNVCVNYTGFFRRFVFGHGFEFCLKNALCLLLLAHIYELSTKLPSTIICLVVSASAQTWFIGYNYA